MNSKTKPTGRGQLSKAIRKTLFLLWLLGAVGLAVFCIPAAHAADGTALWTNVFIGAGNNYDYAQSLAVDGSGNVYVTGYAHGGVNYDYATIKYSGAGVPLRTNMFNGAGNNADYAQTLIVDSSGNVYVTGSSTGSGGNSDYATIKYSSAGVPLWTNVFNGAGNGVDIGRALAVDGSGNVYVTGSATGSGSGVDYATIKYTSAGVPVWTNVFKGAGNSTDEAYSLAVDGSGNVYVTGASTGSGSGYDYATIKYSGAGVPLWTNIFNGAGNNNDFARSLAVDGNANVYVTGYATGIGSGYNYVTIKYTSAGLPLWTNVFNGAGNSTDFAYALALDGNANVYVTGYATGIGGNSDYATIKYTSAGMPVWTNLFNGAGNNSDFANSLAVDGSGNVYVTGSSTGSGGNSDYATIKYTSAGMPVWTNLFNGAGNGYDEARSVAVDGSGNVYVTGYATGSGIGYDYVTIKYSGPLTSPLVITNPANQTVAITSNAIFSVTATGAAPLAYQWRFNAAAIVGGTNSSLTVSNVQFANEGNYYVIVTNSFGSVTSQLASLKVLFVINTTNGGFGITNRQFRFTLTGPVGSNAVISASTNLQSWTPLVTNPLGSGTLMFTDTMATNFSRRFYRATLRP